MNKIILIGGKSSSGKDAISKAMMNNSNLKLITPCTTRPMRMEESNFDPYYFITDDQVDEKMIAKTAYKRVDGTYYYGFVNEKLKDHNYLAVVNPMQVKDICNMYQDNFKIILYIITTDEEARIIKAIEREKKNDMNYEELCRRIITDAYDFSDKNPVFLCARDCVNEVNFVFNDYEMTPNEIAIEILKQIRVEEE